MTELGTVLDGKYEILKKVGQGGMSIVYLAMYNRLNKQWAVKEIKNDGSKSTATLLKGLSEKQISSRMWIIRYCHESLISSMRMARSTLSWTS